ncbi:FAD-binding domain-containing protein [Deinococcus sp.]|uniref:FAD-binding domain-containing protein n=1 Tax=Deinococcus sp. TaxID=47478 RepID=UPI0025ED9886|nr:FAD-binding domain-containing protein [Deinococcus sp.]
MPKLSAAALPPSLRDVPVAELFAEVFAQSLHHRGFAPGGRAAAQGALAQLDAVAYGRDRSHLGGHASRLSPYLHHGALTLSEVRDAALAQAPQSAPSRVWKYVNELSWHDYFNRVYAEIGELVWRDLQPYQTGHPADTYARTLPADIVAAETGAACIDAWSRELRESGYLHNHVRMWLASYVVHHRRVWWQAGAGWFITHLLDGDPANNNLNWQWVASTWRAYPYLWNRGNLVRYAGERYCAGCPLAQTTAQGGCPFEATYAELSRRLFAGKAAAPGETGALDPARLQAVPWESPPTPEPLPNVVVWVHGERLSPTHEALVSYPDQPAVFVWDDELLREWEVSAKRLSFIHECVQELPVHVLRGDVAAEVGRFARAHGAVTVATTPSPSPRFAATVTALQAAGLEVQLWPQPVFGASLTPLDLRVHADYWRQISASAFGKAPAPPKPRRPRTKKAAPPKSPGGA